jgi:hypothetical protein
MHWSRALEHWKQQHASERSIGALEQMEQMEQIVHRVSKCQRQL